MLSSLENSNAVSPPCDNGSETEHYEDLASRVAGDEAGDWIVTIMRM